MADRIGVILKGELILVEDKARLMQKLGKKQLSLSLTEPLAALPEALADWRLELKPTAAPSCIYTFDVNAERTGVTVAPAPPRRPWPALLRPRHARDLARGHLRQPGPGAGMTVNWYAILAIYQFEMHRALRTPAEHRRTGADHLALLHRLRRRDRLEDERGQRRALRHASSCPAW